MPLIDPEDLVIAKVLAGRPKDIEDARGLWQLHGATLNAERILDVLGQLEEALAHGDLVASFEPSPRGRRDAGRFRASTID